MTCNTGSEKLRGTTGTKKFIGSRKIPRYHRYHRYYRYLMDKVPLSIPLLVHPHVLTLVNMVIIVMMSVVVALAIKDRTLSQRRLKGEDILIKSS